jgi:hypothetical protein
MPITHVNAKGQTYYLHQGTTKTGKPKYHFAMKREGNLADRIPEGFEIYENPNAQVFLRRIPPTIITDEERETVEDGMRKSASVTDYKIDVRGKAIVVYTADQDVDTLAGMLREFHPDPMSNPTVVALLRGAIHYSPMMQFILDDPERRLFTAQRSCFRGSIDDWIDIDHGKLPTLVRTYGKHLGNASSFALF